MKSAERLNKFKEKFHPDTIFVVGDGGLKPFVTSVLFPLQRYNNPIRFTRLNSIPRRLTHSRKVPNFEPEAIRT